MILSFRDKASEDLFNGRSTKAARRRLPQQLWPKARRLFDQIGAVGELKQLGIPPGNELEALSRDRAGQHSVRINDQYRICFEWTTNGVQNVEVTDYH